MGWGGAGTTALKYFKTLKRYKNSTGTCQLDAELKFATSYGHWCFLKVIKGKTVFNHYRYSNSTSSHQACVRSVLRSLKIKIDVEVNQRESLGAGIVVDSFVEARELALLRLKRKGLTGKSRARLEANVKDAEKTLKYLREKLGVTVPRALLKSIRADVLENETRRLSTNRAARTTVEVDETVKEELTDLGKIDLLDKMNLSDDLNQIDLNN